MRLRKSDEAWLVMAVSFFATLTLIGLLAGLMLAFLFRR